MTADPKIATLDDIAAIERRPLSDRIEFTSTHDVLVDCAARWGSRPAITFQLKGDPKGKAFTWDYNRLLDETNRAANLFRSLGAQGGNSVALILPNLPETVAAQFAAQTASIVSPINPLLEPEQIASILRDADATVVVTLKAFPKSDIAQRVAAALEQAPQVQTVIEIDLRKYLTPPLSWIIPLIRPKSAPPARVKVLDWDTALRGQPGDRLTFEIPEGGLDRVAAYFHTGGTTGDPKLATHTIGGMLFIANTVRMGVLEGGDTILCALPLFHCFGAYVMGLSSPYAGGHLVIMTPAGFRGEGVIDNFYKLVERYRVNFFMSVPTALAALNQRDVDADVSSLVFTICGSAPLPLELFRSFEKKTGIRILEGYGQTEATVICSVNPPAGERKVGSVGFPVPYTRMASIQVDDRGGFIRFSETDEIGELCIRGPHVFPGYKEVEKNEKVFVSDDTGERWLRSGDLGRLDPDGYFWITGRAKDLIIRGGHNIDPGLIEEVLVTHPAVAFAGAIGQPDAYSGELPCAYVELKEGASATPGEIVEFCREHVGERAARPVHVAILDELPKTAVGKIFKPDLRKDAIARVLGAALEAEKIHATVHVEKDKLKGLIAVIDPANEGDSDRVAHVLNSFAVPWRLQSESSE